MGNFIDLSDKWFGRLLVIERNGTDKFGYATFLCQCKCGNQTTVSGHSLRQGLIQSCGCLQAEQGPNAIQTRQKFEKGIKPSYFQTDKPQSNNKSGYRGVVQYRQAGKIKYRATLTVNGKVHMKSGFKNAKDAHKYRKELEVKYLPTEIETKD